MITNRSALVKLTKQGVRNLDAIGPKPMRGHVGRVEQQAPCHHVWRWFNCGICWMGDDHCSCRQECAKCGEPRRER